MSKKGGKRPKRCIGCRILYDHRDTIGGFHSVWCWLVHFGKV